MLMRIRPALGGVRRKLERCKRHLDELDALMYGDKAGRPYRFAYELNADKALYECFIREVDDRFGNVSILIGEICYQLRSALDYIVFDFAAPNFPSLPTQLDRAIRSTYFPILLGPNDSALRGRLQYVSQEVFKIVEDLQPYKARHGDPAIDELWVLEQMNLWDKHRHLNIMQGGIHITTSSIPPGVQIRTDSFNETEAFALIPIDLDPEEDFEPLLTVEIVVEVPPKSTLNIRGLHALHEYVRDKVLPRFDGLASYEGPLTVGQP